MDINYKKYHRDHDYEKFNSLFANIFTNRFNIIKKHVNINRSGKVLDIGASTGIFLDLFKNKKWETWGIEPSVSSKISKSKGHKVIVDFFEKAKLPNDYFDLVIINHTLEHLDDPILVLDKIYKILKKDGILFIDVPNFGSLGSKILGKNWPYLLPDEHKSQFTKKSLGKMLKKCRYEIIEWKSRSGVFEYANPFLELRRKRFLLEILYIPYHLLATILNMGDSMSFIAKKND